MDKRAECEAYLKNFMITTKVPESDYQPTEEDWNRMPKHHKDTMIDMVLGFTNGGTKYQEIVNESKKKHSDVSFGMIVKAIIKK